VKVQLIFGYPGEDYETLEATASLFKRINHPGRAMAPVVPIPGTKTYEFAKEKGLIQDEEEFLDKIRESFDKRTCIVNLTRLEGLGSQELDALKQKYDKKMINNYISFVLRHPLKLAKALKYRAFRKSLLLRALEKFWMYNVAREIRKKVRALR